MKRITLIGPVYPYRGGITIHTALAADALVKRGHQLRVISFRRQYPAWLYPGKTDQDQSLQAIQTPAEFLLDPLSPWTWYKTASQVAASQPDLVAIQWWTTFWSLPDAVLARFIKWKGCRVVYIIHNVLPHEQRPWDAWLARLALSPAQACIVHTEEEKERLLNLLPESHVLVTPLPVYRVFREPKISRFEARRQLGLHETGPLLLFFGFVRPYKGLGVLLEAMGILHQQGIRPYLAIAGEFWQDKPTYLEQIAQMDLGEQVRIEDRYIPYEELEVWFAAADVVVAPYIEGTTQSGVASLVLGFGLPLILSEQVAQGVNQANLPQLIVTPTGDAPALANAIAGFIDNLKDQPATRQPALDDWDAMVELLMRLADKPTAGD